MLTDRSLRPLPLTLRRTLTAGMLVLALTAPLASQSLPRAKPDDVLWVTTSRADGSPAP